MCRSFGLNKRLTLAIRLHVWDAQQGDTPLFQHPCSRQIWQALAYPVHSVATALKYLHLRVKGSGAGGSRSGTHLLSSLYLHPKDTIAKTTAHPSAAVRPTTRVCCVGSACRGPGFGCSAHRVAAMACASNPWYGFIRPFSLP